LKKIFEGDIHGREEREGKSMDILRAMYRRTMERVWGEEREREDGEKLLMGVVEQLVEHIIEA